MEIFVPIISIIGTLWAIFWGVYTWTNKKKRLIDDKKNTNINTKISLNDIRKYDTNVDKVMTSAEKEQTRKRGLPLGIPVEGLSAKDHRIAIAASSIVGFIYIILKIFKPSLLSPIFLLFLFIPLYILFAIIVFDVGWSIMNYLTYSMIIGFEKVKKLLKKSCYKEAILHFLNLVLVNTIVVICKHIYMISVLYFNVLMYANEEEMEHIRKKLLKKLNLELY